MLYLSAVALYVLKTSFDTTLFYLTWLIGYENIFRTLAYIVIFLKAGYLGAYRRIEGVAGLLMFIVFRNSWLSNDYDFLLDTALLIVGATGTSYRKILKTGFWISLCVLALAMLGSFTGCIPDLIYMDDSLFKHSFGIVYPTDFAAHIAFLFLAGWVLYGETLKAMYFVYALGLCIYVYRYTDAKCSTIVLFLSAISVLYVLLTEKYREQAPAVQRLAKWGDRCLAYAVPLCALAMIFLTLLYNAESSIMNGINSLLTGRLYLGRRAVDEYGIKLFGTAFPQIGFGGTTAWSWASEYKFVDSSYILILVRYGATVLAAICTLSVYMSKKAVRHKQQRLLMAVVLVAIHSMIEHHLLEAEYNLFLLLPFAAYDVSDGDKGKYPYPMGGKRYAPYAMGLCAGLLAVAFLPRFVTRMKTIVDIYQLSVYENRIWYVVITTECLLWVCLVIRLLFKGISAFVMNLPLPRIVPIGLGALLIIFVLSILWSETTLYQYQDEYKWTLDADRPIIELLLANDASEKLYVDHVPELYKREFKGISDNVLSAEGLATRDSITLITTDESELRILISAGYEYGQLESGHAVYTNSKRAKALLKEAGIELTDYYSKKQFINLDKAAQQNNFEIARNGGLILSKNTKPFWHGPGSTICKGILQIWYTIRLVNAVETAENAAVFSIYSDQRQHMWKQEEIYLTDFDQNGMLSYTLECELPFDCPYVEFCLSVSGDVTLEIQEIGYGKVK